MSDRLVLATAGVLPVVVGQRNATGTASIPATNGTALAISSDNVLIRDLTVNAGTTSGSKGIVAMGAGTSVTLLRVNANLTTGLGLEADTGTTLTMNECSVTGNGAGGILLNGAAFDIENTTITNNGPGTFNNVVNWGGILINSQASGGPTKLASLTIQTNNPVGISCTGPVSGSDVSVSGSTSGIDISTTASCGFMSCGSPSLTCGAQ